MPCSAAKRSAPSATKYTCGLSLRILRAARTGLRNALNTAHAAAAQGGAIHDERVELHFAVAIQKAAAAGVEGLVIFHDDDSFFDRIERRPAALEHAPARSHGVAHAVEMSFHHVVRNGPGAAMNYQNRIGAREILRMCNRRMAAASCVVQTPARKPSVDEVVC